MAQPVAVKVMLLGELARIAGRREVDLRLPERSTVDTLGRALRALLPAEFGQRVLTTTGELQSHVAVFMNGEQLPEAQGGTTYLTAGEVLLMLVPMYEGG